MRVLAWSRHALQCGLVAAVGLALASCGDEGGAPSAASFGAGAGSEKGDASKGSRGEGDALVAKPDGEGGSSGNVVDGSDSLDGGGTIGGGIGGNPRFNIPGASLTELEDLNKCLSKWQGHPFSGTVDNFTRVAASVTVGGMGNAINDTTRTAQPHLYLLAAGVNVLGSPTYNLMNPNGYYCITVGVNVLTKLNVNLHCNAHLADSVVDVNVLSSQTGASAGVGVDVLSDVTVNTVRPTGDSCVR